MKSYLYLFCLLIIANISLGQNNKLDVLIYNKAKDYINTHNYKGIDSLVNDSSYYSPNFYGLLNCAVDLDQLDVVKFLVEEENFDVNKTIYDKQLDRYFFPLQIASINGNNEIINYLLSKGANVNQTKGFANALMGATDFENIETIKLLLKNGANVNITSPRGETPVFYARASIPIIQLLISKGANVKAKNYKGNQVLFNLCKLPGNNYPDEHANIILAVQILLKNGADINNKNIFGHTALDTAVKSVNFKLMNYLYSSGAKGNTDTYNLFLRLKISNNDSTDIQKLILDGAEINEVAEYESCSSCYDTGYTPLQLASFKKNVKAMSILLENGADPNLTGKKNISPLIITIKNDKLANNKNLFEILLKKGVDINYKDRDGGFPLIYSENIYYTRRLIESGVNVFQVASNGNTALHNGKDSASIELLVKNGINVNASNYFGNTPVFGYLEPNYLLQLRTLIKLGADVNAKNLDGNTPLHIAASSGEIDVIKILRQNGAKSTRNKFGKTPLDLFKILAESKHNRRIPDFEKQTIINLLEK